MGGYGGDNELGKSPAYTDTGGNIVRDKNAIKVAEHYLDEGHRVAFLQEHSQDNWRNRADLLIDDNMVIEIKGMTSKSATQIADKIKQAFIQTQRETERMGKSYIQKVVILHSDRDAANQGYQRAKRRGYIKGELEIWINGKIIKFD